MKSETKLYAELIIGMSTDFLMGTITEEHYKNTIEMTVKNLVKYKKSPNITDI